MVPSAAGCGEPRLPVIAAAVRGLNRAAVCVQGAQPYARKPVERVEVVAVTERGRLVEKKTLAYIHTLHTRTEWVAELNESLTTQATRCALSPGRQQTAPVAPRSAVKLQGPELRLERRLDGVHSTQTASSTGLLSSSPTHNKSVEDTSRSTRQRTGLVSIECRSPCA